MSDLFGNAGANEFSGLKMLGYLVAQAQAMLQAWMAAHPLAALGELGAPLVDRRSVVATVMPDGSTRLVPWKKTRRGTRGGKRHRRVFASEAPSDDCLGRGTVRCA